MRRRLKLACVCAWATLWTVGCQAPGVDERPNILLIVADDLGYTDVGFHGGEIETPNLDALAGVGMMMTNFHVHQSCSPTRSVLLSGTDNHLAGLGTMSELLLSNQRGQPGYEGYLNFRVVSVASLLHDAGYHTYLSGKWHLGRAAEHSPAARGFEKSFAFLHGGGSHFADMAGLSPEDSRAEYRVDGEEIFELPEDFFSSEFYVDKMIEYIDNERADGRPFFGYLAFTAPHDPLHAPDEWLEKYRGVYDDGYDELRARRLARQKELGLLPEDAVTFPRLPTVPAWDELSDEAKAIEAREMEAYAAMVDNMDFHIGRMLDYLREIGEYDNTLIIFFSDNGANGAEVETYPSSSPEWVAENFDNSLENIGRRGSFVGVGPSWAQVGMVPFRLFKGTVAEGGIRTPFVAVGPGIPAARSDAFAHVADIVPTLLELAGAEHPSTYEGREVLPLRGASMLSFMRGERGSVHENAVVGAEFVGQKALIQGDWKALFLPQPWGPGEWQLYNLAEDPAELNDLAAQMPEKLEELIGLYDAYESEVGVVPPDMQELFKRIGGD